jgi:hypothetical protein
VGPARSAQSQAIEAQDALQVGEQHLDFLPLSPRAAIGLGLGDGAGQLTIAFVDAARHLPGRLIGTAAPARHPRFCRFLRGHIRNIVPPDHLRDR